MSMIKRTTDVNPFSFFDDDLNNTFEGFFRPANRAMAAGNKLPNVDIKENDNAYQLTAELPGFDKDEIELDFSNGMLSIKAEHTEETTKEEGKQILNERHYGHYMRSFNFGDTVVADDISAKFDKGVLELTMPKVVDSETGKKKIDIK